MQVGQLFELHDRGSVAVAVGVLSHPAFSHPGRYLLELISPDGGQTAETLTRDVRLGQDGPSCRTCGCR